MRPPIDGGIVLITGASSGIGLEMAKLLAPRAARLILVARRKERLEKLKSEQGALHPKLEIDVEPCDLTNVASTAALADRLLARHGAIDVLINCAGMGYVGLFDQNEWTKLDTLIAVNVTALTLLTFKLVPAMVARKKGGVLNVSSGYGLNWSPMVAAYCATKHYVTAFTESLRMDLAGTGVVVSQLCPGPVPTEFDEVAGTPIKIPKLIQVPPARVAKKAINGFSRGRALMVPGVLISCVMFFGAWTPRWFLRLFYRGVAPLFRKGSSLLPLLDRTGRR